MDAKNLPTLPVGQRIKLYRERAGKTRAVLGGLVGRSPEWVKAVETGRIQPPRVTMLNQLAKALRIDVAAITESEQAPATIGSPGHAHLPAVREALESLADRGRRRTSTARPHPYSAGDCLGGAALCA